MGGGGQIGSKIGGGGSREAHCISVMISVIEGLICVDPFNDRGRDRPKVVFLFLVQGEKWGRGRK